MIKLALRYLTSKPKQTLLTLLGIILGSAGYISISGMMLGFQLFIIDQLVNNDSHVRITARDEPVSPKAVKESLFQDQNVQWISPPSGRRGEQNIQNTPGWLERLRQDEDVKAYAPQLVVRGVISFGKQTFPISLKGIEAAKQTKVSTLENYMVSGKLKDLDSGGNRIVLGKTLMESLGAQEDSTVFVSNGRSAPTPFRVSGVFFLGVKSMDESVGYVSIRDAQSFNQTPSVVSDIVIRLNKVDQASEKASQWAMYSQDKVQSWDQANDGILSVFKTQDIVRNVMTVSILIVAGFGIFNILNMSVTQKRKEIAILRSIGFLPKDIEKLFLTQGVLLGLVGGLFGIIAGYLACRYMATIEVSSSRGLGNGRMMVSFLPSIYIKGFGLALLSSSFAAFFPARSAGKMRPMEIIRSE